MPEERCESILIVEDDAGVASVLRRRLELFGFRVHTETTGRTALSYAAEHQPGLVLLDLRLPDIGGYEVCKELRRLYNRWQLPIVMVTGMDKPVDQLRGFACGADAYLTKPFELGEVVRTVELLLGESAQA